MAYNEDGRKSRTSKNKKVRKYKASKGADFDDASTGNSYTTKSIKTKTKYDKKGEIKKIKRVQKTEGGGRMVTVSKPGIENNSLSPKGATGLVTTRQKTNTAFDNPRAGTNSSKNRMKSMVDKVNGPKKTTKQYTDNLRDKTRTQSREFDKQGTRTTIYDRKGREKKVIDKSIGGIPEHSTYVKKETTKFSKKLRKQPIMREESGKMKTKTVVISPRNIQHDDYYGEFTGVRSKEGKKIRSKNTYDFETLETTYGKSKRKNLNPKQFSRQSKKLQK